MFGYSPRQPTIGVLVSWQVYEGTTIGRYLHTLLRGIYAQASTSGCNLLLACGVGGISHPGSYTPAWPVPAPDTDFVPIGPWNSDGLIVVPHRLSPTQAMYLQQLINEGYPVVFAGPAEAGPSVVADNAGGIRQAFTHLLEHGHRQIAFIAGFAESRGDSAERFQAYQLAMHEAGLAVDPRLTAYGEHNVDDGRRAMRQILATTAPFSAVLASNDLSAFGAMDVLVGEGLRIPEDVAVIGFDDLLDARAQSPPLTTVRHSTFGMGCQALNLVLNILAGTGNSTTTSQGATQLIVRQSCGCRPGITMTKRAAEASHTPDSYPAALVQAMTEVTLIEARYIGFDEISAMCKRLVTAFIATLLHVDDTAFDQALADILRRTDELDDDPYAWHAAISTLRKGLSCLLTSLSEAIVPQQAEDLLDRARLEISERMRRQGTRALVRQMDVADQLGLMTAQFLAALDETQLPAILASHLPRIGVRHVQVVLFEPDADDPFAWSVLTLRYGLQDESARRRFATRQFPPPDVYPPNEPFHLALLPLTLHEQPSGFVAFDAANLEPCAAIVRNLASALRSSHLYVQARAGQQAAEDANRLKSRFLSMVSHELRTPLNLIVGLSEMLLRDQEFAETAATDLLRQDIERIYSNAQYLGRLIGDVLDLSSSEAGRLRLIRELVDLNEVLSVVATAGEQMVRDKGLDWQISLPREAPWVLGDRTRLRQIVFNLINNAVKFTARGHVELKVELLNQQVRVVVSDTGLGIPEEDQALIFEEFGRSTRTITRGYGGLGLGLAICKQLVELHEGTISVESPGGDESGTTFSFTLPIILRPQQTERPSASTLHQQQVLILSQVQNDGERLGVHLRKEGFDVVVQPVDAMSDWLDYLAAAPPGAVVLDLPLASEWGWELMKGLKSNLVTQDIPVLFYSLEQTRDTGSMLELQYLLKPLSANQLTRVLAHQGLVPQGTNAKTVVVVDDDLHMLELHVRMVQAQSPAYRVLTARNGHEALALIQQTSPDLVLLDLMMPELDGFGVLEVLSRDAATNNLPVIVLTGQALTESDMVRLNRSVAAVLQKDLFSTDETLTHITSALAHHRRLGTAAQRLVRRAMAYLHEHYTEPVTRLELARYTGVNEDYLTQCFNQELGIAPIAYLTRYRMKQARALLEAGNRSITEVATSVGFVDSAYFSRVFQREVGVSPAAYRRGQRGRPA